MHQARVLVTTTDGDQLRSLTGALDDYCHVAGAETGLDCLTRLRAEPPDLLVLAPPLLWGSAAGILAVMQEDPRLHDVPVLFLSDSDMFRATAQSDPPPGLIRVINRVCKWAHKHRPTARPALLRANPAPARPDPALV